VTNYNIGIEQCDKFFVIRDGIILKEIERYQGGRAKVGWMDHVFLVNIYAPSGSNSRLEREVFFNNEVIYFLRRTP
jgi:hypothetical protein